MRSYRTKRSECPKCAHKLDAATAIGPKARRPRPGNLSVCISCAALLRFDERLALVELTQQELEALPIDAAWELMRIRRAVLLMQQERTNENGEK